MAMKVAAREAAIREDAAKEWLSRGSVGSPLNLSEDSTSAGSDCGAGDMGAAGAVIRWPRGADGLVASPTKPKNAYPEVPPVFRPRLELPWPEAGLPIRRSLSRTLSPDGEKTLRPSRLSTANFRADGRGSPSPRDQPRRSLATAPRSPEPRSPRHSTQPASRASPLAALPPAASPRPAPRPSPQLAPRASPPRVSPRDVSRPPPRFDAANSCGMSASSPVLGSAPPCFVGAVAPRGISESSPLLQSPPPRFPRAPRGYSDLASTMTPMNPPPLVAGAPRWRSEAVPTPTNPPSFAGGARRICEAVSTPMNPPPFVAGAPRRLAECVSLPMNPPSFAAGVPRRIPERVYSETRLPAESASRVGAASPLGGDRARLFGIAPPPPHACAASSPVPRRTDAVSPSAASRRGGYLSSPCGPASPTRRVSASPRSTGTARCTVVAQLCAMPANPPLVDDVMICRNTAGRSVCVPPPPVGLPPTPVPTYRYRW